MEITNIVYLFISVAIGAVIVEIFKPNNNKNIQLLLTFSGAYLLAVSVIHPGNAATNIWKGREEISEREGLIPLEDLGKLAVTMLTMSPNVNILGSVILPITQPYLGRG